ncbi:MAG: N-acetylmuramoyl-L-alanine amidase [Desulfobacterales bacterium]|nr:N-acetylmuramoyl-L-alanine amidase [Desulfobacterales bacterium]
MIKKRRWVFSLTILVFFSVVAALLLPRFRFDAIIIHHSASWSDNYESIKSFHKRKHGWRDAAYHLILSNGRTKIPAGRLEASNRYRNLSYSLATRSARCNLRGVHVCIVGNYDQKEVPANLRPPIAHALRLLMEKYAIKDDGVLFHRDCNSTACPGRYITKGKIRAWIRSEAANCPPEIARQQKMVIDDASYSIHTAPRPVFWGILVVLAALCTGWFILWRRKASRPVNEETVPENENRV